MGWFTGFTLITAPPADEFVDEQAQLNDNWDILESRLSYLQGIGSVADGDKEKGVEAFVSSRQAVWNGSSWRNPNQIDTSWGAWTTMTWSGTHQAVSGFPTRYRINTFLRKVQVVGRVQVGATGTVFNKASFNTLTTTSGGVPAANAPITGIHMQDCGTHLVSAATPSPNDYSHARIKVEVDGSNTVKMTASHNGGDFGATGNYISLDGLEWWY